MQEVATLVMEAEEATVGLHERQSCGAEKLGSPSRCWNHGKSPHGYLTHHILGPMHLFHWLLLSCTL